jgi:hypothetical protein
MGGTNKQIVVACGIAVFINPLIYGFMGWIVWRISKAWNPSLR